VAKGISSKQKAANKGTAKTLSSTNDISVTPDINSEENIITAPKRKMESTAKNKEAKKIKSTAAVNAEKVKQMQHELLQLKELQLKEKMNYFKISKYR
jgi:hypothetical protein